MQMNARINAFDVFKEVALDLYKKINKSSPSQTFNELIAFVVNGSLACELGFKAILAEDYQIYTGHKLEELFNKLDTSVKAFIKANMPSMKKDEEGSKEFDCVLTKVSNNFVEWRYYYEKNIKTNWLFLYELICALDKYFIGDNYFNYLESLIRKENK